MTNLNSVNIGQNKYCGPAVLSILTGKGTDECARVISRINGQYNVVGVLLNDLLRAADQLGFDQKRIEPAGSLYGTLVRLAVNGDGMYIITVPNHFVAIEVNNKKVYFCDNHTKEPMPASASARLLQKVLGVNQVIKRPETVIPPPEPKPVVNHKKDRIELLKNRMSLVESQIVDLMDRLAADKAELNTLLLEVSSEHPN